MGPERGLQPRICNRVIRADDMPEGAPVTDIVVSKGSVYQMTSKEKKGDVGNKVFADDDVVKEGDIVIKLFHPGKVPG